MKNSISAKWKTESLTQKQKIYLFQNKGQQMFLRKIALTTTVTILCSAFSASAMDSQKRWIVKQNYMKKIDLNALLFESKYVIEKYIDYMCSSPTLFSCDPIRCLKIRIESQPTEGVEK